MADDIKPVSIPEPLTATVITNDEPVSSRIPTTPGRQPDVSKRRISDTAEKITYFVALLAGSAFILLGKTAGWLTPTAGAVAAFIFIVAYFGVSWLSIRQRVMRADRLGDNCYYLGLVYTLASLIATLIQIEGGAEIAGLLGNFGVALVSTATGIIARLILIQFRSENDDVEDRARNDLAQAAQEMRSSLLSSAEAFRTLLVGAQETFRISIEHTRANVEDAREITERMKGMEVSPETLNTALKATVVQLEAAGARLSEAGREIRDQANAVTSTVTAAERSEVGLRKIDHVLNDLARTLEKQRAATENIVAALDGQKVFLAQHRAAMEADAERAREAVQKVYSALGDLANTIVRRVN
jgi:hypothetical protein